MCPSDGIDIRALMVQCQVEVHRIEDMIPACYWSDLLSNSLGQHLQVYSSANTCGHAVTLALAPCSQLSMRTLVLSVVDK